MASPPPPSEKKKDTPKTPYPPYNQPPQIAYGWFCPHPPPYGPYFWPCLPPGYTLVPVNKAKGKPTSNSSSAATATPVAPPPVPKAVPKSAAAPRGLASSPTVPVVASPAAPAAQAERVPQEQIPPPAAAVTANVLAPWPFALSSQASRPIKRTPPTPEGARRNVKRKVGESGASTSTTSLGLHSTT